MDEPFGALDALTREQMNLEMLKVWRESGKTIIFVTHSIQEAVFLGSHCAVLTAGPARMAEYFPIDLPFPRALPIKTTDEFGAYARRIYASLGLGAARFVEPSLRGACRRGNPRLTHLAQTGLLGFARNDERNSSIGLWLTSIFG